MQLSNEEWQTWRDAPITQFFLKHLERMKAGYFNHNTLCPDNIDKTVIDTATRHGEVSAITDVISVLEAGYPPDSQGGDE